MSHHHGPIPGRFVAVQYLEGGLSAICQQKPDHFRSPMLGREVERMLPHSIADDHLAPMIEQYLDRPDTAALGRPVDG